VRAIALAGLLACGCSYPTGQSMYGALCEPVGMTVVSSTPADGATGIETKSAITVVFDQFPDPATVAFPAITLRSGTNSFDFDAHVELVAKSVVIVPKSPLTPSTGYVLVLAASGTSAVGGLGCAQLAPTSADGQSVQISFTTGTTTGTGPVPPPPHTVATDVGPKLMATCGIIACHAPCDVMTCGSVVPPMEGLDLSTAALILSNTVNVGATEEPSLARVKPNDPASSYLLRKLLGTPDIGGARMPIGTAFSAADSQLISDWILEGAP
jgi:hypothetical protein